MELSPKVESAPGPEEDQLIDHIETVKEELTEKPAHARIMELSPRFESAPGPEDDQLIDDIETVQKQLTEMIHYPVSCPATCRDCAALLQKCGFLGGAWPDLWPGAHSPGPQ
jgi:predicted Zn-ribbon and HTH transcriptional regulator